MIESACLDRLREHAVVQYLLGIERMHLGLLVPGELEILVQVLDFPAPQFLAVSELGEGLPVAFLELGNFLLFTLVPFFLLVGEAAADRRGEDRRVGPRQPCGVCPIESHSVSLGQQRVLALFLGNPGLMHFSSSLLSDAEQLLGEGPAVGLQLRDGLLVEFLPGFRE